MRPDSFTSHDVLAIQVFLSPDNWFGFGPADFLVFGLAVLILFAPAALRGKLHWQLPRFRSSVWAALVAALPVALRMALLPRYPKPLASGADDFGYLLLADTLRHFRLANPPHAFPEFFAQIFVLQKPTFSSMFNLGQGLALASGWILFGDPWAGVLLSLAAFCGLCYWMLRGWTTPGWALAGGFLAAIEFGPLNYWTNSYWGGAVSACAGCLVFGGLPRLIQSRRKRDALAVGLGLAIQMLTRPFEFLLLVAAVLIYWPLVRHVPGLGRFAVIISAVVLSAGGLVLLQNKAVTGKWVTTPYQYYRHQYGVPATFTFQQNPVPHEELNGEQERDYKAETAIHGDTPESVRAYVARLLFRVRFYRFFFLAPLYLAVFAFLLTIRDYRRFWIGLSILIFALGANFYPYFYPHYIAAVTCVFVLIGVEGLRQIDRFRGRAGTLLLVLCAAQFLFFYSARLIGDEHWARYESWDFLNPNDPQGRSSISRMLEHTPGKLLVFVHYAPGHQFAEWIHNEADIDASRIIWVHDLDEERNLQLQRHYPGRTALLCEPDATPPRLAAYPVQRGPFQEVR